MCITYLCNTCERHVRTGADKTAALNEKYDVFGHSCAEAREMHADHVNHLCQAWCIRPSSGSAIQALEAMCFNEQSVETLSMNSICQQAMTTIQGKQLCKSRPDLTRSARYVSTWEDWPAAS